MTQKETILGLLRQGPVCSYEFYRREGVTHRLAARILDLKHDGYNIVSRACKAHRHQSNAVEYVLTEVDQMSLPLANV